MKKILIFGGTGMLGHQLASVMNDEECFASLATDAVFRRIANGINRNGGLWLLLLLSLFRQRALQVHCG